MNVPLHVNSFPFVGTFVPLHGTFPSRMLAPYGICVPCPCYAVSSSFLLLFACFGCKNTLNSGIFVMKRENLALFGKKVL